MASITITELLERNKQQAATHSPLPSIAEMPGLNMSFPQVIIVSCTDPRVIPENIFNLAPGEAFVMRNVAGHPQTAFKDILVLDTFLKISEIVVMHHTDCGSLHFTDDSIRSGLKDRLPDNRDLDSMSFGAISTSTEDGVRDDLKFLKESPMMRKELSEHLHGFLYDIKTGKVQEIKAVEDKNL